MQYKRAGWNYLIRASHVLPARFRYGVLAGLFVLAFLLTPAQDLLQLNSLAKAAPLSLCGNQGTAPAIQHVVVVMMENLSYKQVVGSSSAPFQTSLAGQCGNATAAFGATHTSAANYLATSAGEYPASSPPGCGTVKACADTSNNLYNQLSGAGLTWGAFMEAMPSACDPTSGDPYKNGHNPPIFYTDISASACQANDLGVPDLTAQSDAFWNDLQNQTLPSFSWVSPSEDNDGEGTGTLAQKELAADTWLQKFLGTVQQSSSYQAGNTLVLVTYDEGNGADYVTGEDCTNQSLDMPVTSNTSAHQDSCHVPLFVVYPYTPAGTADGAFFTHYSITKTVEDIFGLPYLAHAGDATTNSLIGHFGLSLPSAPDTIPPSVNITQPASGSSVSGTLTLSGTASDNVGVTQVKLSVDGGTPVTASGTTSWMSTLNTTTLSNGSHTLTATASDAAGNVGTSSVPFTINNTVATACAATPAGMTELSSNLSLEANQNGWTGVYNTTSAVSRFQPSGGSYAGSWALKVAPKSGSSGTAGVNNASPVWVPGSPGTSTVAGKIYKGSAEVAASTPGETVSLIVRETTASGTGVNNHTTTMTLNDTKWHQITSSYTAKSAGDIIRYSIYATNFASSSQYFLADCLSLQTP